MALHRGLVVLIAGVTAAATVGGIAQAGPRTASLGTADDVVRQTSRGVSLSPTGGVQTTVIAQSLPAGAWVLSSNVTLVSWGPSDYTRCSLYAGDAQVGGATTMIGNPNAPDGSGAAVFVATLSVQGAFSSTSDKDISLRCGHDSNRPANGTAYVDPGATVWAHKSDALG